MRAVAFASTILTASVALGPAAPAGAQSFSCGGSLNGAERAVCASDELSQLDVSVARMYGQLRYGPSQWHRNAALRSQREFLQRRNRCGGDFVCLLDAYEAQASNLNGLRRAN